MSNGTASSFGKKNYESNPKKQAKSYEIDLGQNNGPYKEELLIRYGDHSLNQMMNKMQSSKNSNMNMEEIMQMNQILKPYQERSTDIDPDNIKDSCLLIEGDIQKVEESSDYLKEFEDNLNKSIELMANDLFKLFDGTYNDFNPELITKYKNMKSQIKDQKDENANLLKQIDLLNQEIKLIFENIIKLGSRLSALEKVFGFDISNENEENMMTTGFKSHK